MQLKKIIIVILNFLSLQLCAMPEGFEKSEPVNTSSHTTSGYLDVSKAKQAEIDKTKTAQNTDVKGSKGKRSVVSEEQNEQKLNTTDLKQEGITEPLEDVIDPEKQAYALEDEAKRAKNSNDVKSILSKIDVKNILPKVISDWAVKVSDYWMKSSFDFSKFFNWVKVTDQLIDSPVEYKDMSNEDLKNVQDAAEEELQKGSHAAGQELPEGSIQLNELSVDMNVDTEKNIKLDDNAEVKDLDLFKEPEAPQQGESVNQKTINAHKKIQEQIDKMSDPGDQEPIFDLFDEMKEASKDLDPVENKDLIDAIDYFLKNKDALLKNPLGFAIFNKSNLIKNKDNLPKPSKPMSEKDQAQSKQAFLGKLKNNKTRVDAKNQKNKQSTTLFP